MNKPIDAWGVCYGNPNAKAEEELELIEAWTTEEAAYSSALEWAHNNDGDPNYIVMPLYRKDGFDLQRDKYKTVLEDGSEKDTKICRREGKQ